jgi:erythromycin esterase
MVASLHGTILGALLVLLSQCLGAQTTRELRLGVSFDTTITASSPHDYRLRLVKGESVDLVVEQRGADLVVEVRDPRDSVASFDSPNGRNGPEPVEIIAGQSGVYSLRVRTFDAGEPTATYHLQINVWRNPGQTSALLRGRELARDSAARWLSLNSATIPLSGVVAAEGSLAPLDSLAARARVIGIGEATHGSREFNDFRVSVTRRLIERNGYRLVAIEGSTARLDVLNKYVRGGIAASPFVTRALESGWIGRRAQRELIPWLRQWNASHPEDKVSLLGLDPQDNQIARDSLQAFLSRAYSPDVMTKLAPMFREFAAADSQTVVFGDSNISPETHGASLQLLGMLDLDADVLAARFGVASVEASRDAARQLVEFAEFNSSSTGIANRSRDYFMAKNLFDALARSGARTKAVFWAHNAHVAHPQNRSPNGMTSGGWLRQWLGCQYAALGASFGEGAFVAQMPNDLTDRLVVSRLPGSPSESIDAVLSKVGPGTSLSVWSCGVSPTSVPSWLTRAHPMHWVGGLFDPASAPSTAFRRFDLAKDFDGVYYLPRVTADEVPTDRPLVPARKR